MSSKVHERFVGERFKLKVGSGLDVFVKCADARQRFSFIELQVSPECGTGYTWVPISVLTHINDRNEEVADEPEL